MTGGSFVGLALKARRMRFRGRKNVEKNVYQRGREKPPEHRATPSIEQIAGSDQRGPIKYTEISESG